MAELVASPFAEKLKGAIAGRVILKAPSVEEPKVVDSVLSADSKSGRRAPEGKPEREKREGKGGPVSGRAIHHRGGLGTWAETSTLVSVETQVEGRNEKGHNPQELMDNIEKAHTLLMALALEHPEAELDINGQNFQDSVRADLEKAKQSIAPYLEPGDLSEVNRSAAYLDAIDTLRTVQVNFEDYIKAIQAAIESARQEEKSKDSRQAASLKPTRPSVGREEDRKPGSRRGREGSAVSLSRNVEGEKSKDGPLVQSVEVEPGESIEEKVAKLGELTARWKTLHSGFPKDYLLHAIRKGWKGDLPMMKAGEWLKSGTDPKKWNADKRVHFETNVLVPMEKWVMKAEKAAPKLRETWQKSRDAQERKKTSPDTLVALEKETPQPVVVGASAEAAPAVSVGEPVVVEDQSAAAAVATEPAAAKADAQREPDAPDQSDPVTAPPLVEDQPDTDHVEPEPTTNVREFRTGRPITDLKDLTEWERSADQSRLRRELFLLKAGFVSRLEGLLRANKKDPAECAPEISQALRTFLLAKIPRVIDKIELTSSDTETLMGELMAAEPVNKS
ncbi:MAG: hypothetical protein IPJ68_04755 [Candidatus Moraniibacteriota bacterium]|nr:MAG: hypothetical protein IPJ68_04755 [Candidatus Moranbacteria bacterium]